MNLESNVTVLQRLIHLAFWAVYLFSDYSDLNNPFAEVIRRLYRLPVEYTLLSNIRLFGLATTTALNIYRHSVAKRYP